MWLRFRNSLARIRWYEWLVCLVVAVVLIALLLPAPQQSFDGLRTLARWRITRVAAAVLNGIEEGKITSRFSNGKIWRIECYDAVASSIGLDPVAPLDSTLLESQLESAKDFFRICGRLRREGERVCWDIRGLEGDGSFWGRDQLSSNCPDGRSCTILLVAINSTQNPWYAPGDPDVDSIYCPPYFGPHPSCRGMVVAMADGSGFWLPPDLSREDFLELISADGDAAASALIVERILNR